MSRSWVTWFSFQSLLLVEQVLWSVYSSLVDKGQGRSSVEMLPARTAQLPCQTDPSLSYQGHSCLLPLLASAHTFSVCLACRFSPPAPVSLGFALYPRLRLCSHSPPSPTFLWLPPVPCVLCLLLPVISGIKHDPSSLLFPCGWRLPSSQPTNGPSPANLDLHAFSSPSAPRLTSLWFSGKAPVTA